MKQEKLIREAISNLVFEKTSKKVRNVWFITRTDHDTIIYGVSGNNYTLFAVAEVNSLGEVEVIC